MAVSQPQPNNRRRRNVTAKTRDAVRTRDDQDRRKAYLAVEPTGIARINEHDEQYGQHLIAVLARRSSSELKIIGDFLAELNSVGTLIGPAPRPEQPPT